ncbi:MAG: hypothetical protein REI09_05975 [Candidatus Dactylopiibacterium sp.]|nr:hypothetical protein [Candidatus Dactylopiibacterium sp.]
MGQQICDQSFVEFLESIKAAGVAITNEAELRERLAETWRWKFAFMTLAANGRPLGINFSDREAGRHLDEIRGAFARHEFPVDSDTVFTRGLATN